MIVFNTIVNLKKGKARCLFSKNTQSIAIYKFWDYRKF